MADTLRLDIVTPQAVVFSEDVAMVTMPAIEGEIGVYPRHVRLITQIVPGELVIDTGAGDRALAVGEGLVEITGERVVIITDMAIPAEDIDGIKAEEARARAAARLLEKISDEEVAVVNASLARSLAQLHVKKRRT